MSQPDSVRPAAPPEEFVRDPLANPGAILAARQRSMAERLELAISWKGRLRASRRHDPRDRADSLQAVTFDASELFRPLARHEVEYVTIGGMAIQVCGAQRLTQDLDVTIASSSEN